MSVPEQRYEVRNPNTAPPGGWRYLQPETMREWSAQPSLDLLVQQVAAHRVHNELPPGDPAADIHHQTGAALVSEGRSHHVKIFQPVHRSLAQYWQGMKGASHIAAFELAGKPVLVPAETAERRAQVCAACPMNVVNTDETPQMKAADASMAALVGGHSVPSQASLGTCSVCTCRAATIIHLTGELLHASGALYQLKKYPAECWKHTAFQP